MSSPDNAPETVVIVGASMAGMFAAAAASGAGASVTLLERDVLQDRPQPRSGVPQGRQPHIFLHRGMEALEQVLPGIRDDLVAAGGVPFDTGDIPWLAEAGWSPLGTQQYEVVSCTRPLLEHVVRERVTSLAGVVVRDGTRLGGLARGDKGFVARTESLNGASASYEGDLVVDATGRSSRLPAYLEAVGVPAPRTSELDARVGYASRLYAVPPGDLPYPGVVLTPTPGTLTGALALLVERGMALVLAIGYGERRPPRDEDGFDAFLAGLRDTSLAALTRRWTPLGDIAVHRQTGNVRHHYEDVADWPDGLLVVGDALCCFNPVYGQGISVAACESQLLAAALRQGSAHGYCGRLLKEFAKLVALPWGISTGEDVRYPTAPGEPNAGQRLFTWWVDQVRELARHGDADAATRLAAVYHLMASPAALLHPALFAKAAAATVRARGPEAQRPERLPSL